MESWKIYLDGGIMLSQRQDYKGAIEVFNKCIAEFKQNSVDNLQNLFKRNFLANIFSNRAATNYNLDRLLDALDDIHISLGLLVFPSSFPWDKKFNSELTAVYSTNIKRLSMIYLQIGNFTSHYQQSVVALTAVPLEERQIWADTIVTMATKNLFLPKLLDIKYDDTISIKSNIKMLGCGIGDNFTKHSYSVEHNGNIYIFGGERDDGKITNRMLKFSILDQTISNIKYTKETPATKLGSMVAYKGRFYLFGGIHQEIVKSWFHCFDPLTNSWEEINCHSKMPHLIHSHTAVVYKDEMIIYGGIRKNKICGDIYGYNFIKKSWRVLYDHRMQLYTPGARKLHQSWVVNDRMYVFSGVCPRDYFGDDGGAVDYNYDDLWYFSFITEKWKKSYFVGGNQPSCRLDFGVVVMDKRAYVMGGYGYLRVNDTKNSNEVVFYNDTFEFGPRKHARETLECETTPGVLQYSWRQSFYSKTVPDFIAGHTMVTHNSKIYIIGGFNTSGAQETIYEVSFTEKKCGNCNLVQTKMKKCGKCQETFYCSAKCQADDWKKHVKTCQEKKDTMKI